MADSIGIVDFNERKIYDQLIRFKKGTFRENRQSKNGFNCNSLDVKEAKDLTVVQRELAEIFAGKLIIGCALAGDFESLGLPLGDYIEDAFDLQWEYFDDKISTKGKEYIERWSLKYMCKTLLKIDIQEDGQSHNALQDAQMTMRIFKEAYMKITPEPAKRSHGDICLF